MILIVYHVVRFLLTVNSLILTYVDRIWIVSICLALSRMNHSTTLDISFLSCTSSPTAHTSWITSTILGLWIEILSSSRKSWQNIHVIILKRFVDFWHSLISTLSLKMMHYSLMSISSWSLASYVGICSGHCFLMLLYVRAIASICISDYSLFVYFLFNCA